MKCDCKPEPKFHAAKFECYDDDMMGMGMHHMGMHHMGMHPMGMHPMGMHHMPMDMGFDDMCMPCPAPKTKCPPVKECVKTYKCYYKLYKISHFRLFKVCPCCGVEYDYHHHRGMCPRCM